MYHSKYESQFNAFKSTYLTFHETKNFLEYFKFNINKKTKNHKKT